MKTASSGLLKREVFLLLEVLFLQPLVSRLPLPVLAQRARRFCSKDLS